MNDYVIRLTMHAPSATSKHRYKLDAAFDLLDELGLAEDVSDIDASGRFSLWLRIVATTPQQALTEALDAVDQADVLVGGDTVGSILGVDIQLEESLAPSTPAAAAG